MSTNDIHQTSTEDDERIVSITEGILGSLRDGGSSLRSNAFGCICPWVEKAMGTTPPADPTLPPGTGEIRDPKTGGGCQQEPCSALGLAVAAWDKKILRPDLRLEMALIIHTDSVAELADNLEYIAARLRETGWTAGSGGGKHSKSVWEMFRKPNVRPEKVDGKYLNGVGGIEREPIYNWHPSWDNTQADRKQVEIAPVIVEEISDRKRRRIDRPWREFPIGTKAHACGGGYWYRAERGWKWNGPDGNGGTFPTPGGEACGQCIELPIPPAERPTPETNAWRKQDMHTLERAFQFMERLERERDEWKERWADLARSAPKDIGNLERQLAEARKQRDRLAGALRMLRNASLKYKMDEADLEIEDANDALASVKGTAIAGFNIIADPTLPPGTGEIRDPKTGEVIAAIKVGENDTTEARHE